MEFDTAKYSTNIGNLKDLAIRVKSIIADIYAAVAPAEIKTRKGIERMAMSDVEIITIAILGELMSIDSERAWYSFCRKNLNDVFPVFCERSRFNRIRRNLHAVIRRCYQEITALVGGSEKETYLGYQLHLLCNPNGYPADFLLTSANVDDRAPVPKLVEGHRILALYADKGYTGEEFCGRMHALTGIRMLPLPKTNAPQPPEEKLIRQHIFKVHRRLKPLIPNSPINWPYSVSGLNPFGD